MFGLDTYASSDEEDESQKEVAAEERHGKREDISRKSNDGPHHPQPEKPASAAEPTVHIPIEAPSDGPSLGPSIPPDAGDVDETYVSEAIPPHANSRSAIRNLTMPPIPNFAIPESPPGSPSLRATKKFDKFLKLKKQGVHFNQKLESSSALANPTLFQKLMDYVGIDEQSQYASALPEDVAVPTKFPEWMYADQLNKTQEELTRKKEQEMRGQPRHFVSGGTLQPESSSGLRTPGGSSRGQGYVSTAERVMQGLERDRRSPAGRRR